MSSHTTEDATNSTSGWRRPEGGEHRSPCPALNTLANEGHIPRNGRNITADQLTRAMERYLGLSPSIGAGLAKAAIARLGTPGPDGVKVLDLADLGLHGFIEHDASLTRHDAHKGDASTFAAPLLEQLVALSQDGKTLTREDLAVAHKLRMVQCRSGGHAVPIKADVLGTLEAALLFAVLSRDGVIAISDLVDFVQHEKIPPHFQPKKVDRALLLSTAAAMAVIGNVPFFNAAKRARKIAADRPAP